MLLDSPCSGGLRAPMLNDSALIETPLQIQKNRLNLKPNSHWHDKSQVEAEKNDSRKRFLKVVDRTKRSTAIQSNSFPLCALRVLRG